MRLYEATGCGALTLTDRIKNLPDLFEENEVLAYLEPKEAVKRVRYFLKHRDKGKVIAERGQARTLKDHTYEQRMKVVAEVLEGML